MSAAAPPPDPAHPRAAIEEEARRRFREAFHGEPAAVAWAPGRVNLIGDHTDTSDGLVLPVALRLGVAFALRAGDGPTRLVHPSAPHGWTRYPEGVLAACAGAGIDLPPVEGTVASDLPMGQGLASSAALSVAFLRAVAELAGLAMDGRDVARLAHAAESRHVGVECGIMDPFSAALGRPGEALFLDTRSLEHRFASLPGGTRLGILPSGVVRELARSPYNDRRREVTAAARSLGHDVLRDVPLEGWERRIEALPVVERRRARHVLSENARVLEALGALEADDPVRLGDAMDRSHASLRDDYEVSCPELDALTEAARRHPRCFGARLTGAGFGGAAIALLQAEGAQETAREVLESCRQALGGEISPILV